MPMYTVALTRRTSQDGTVAIAADNPEDAERDAGELAVQDDDRISWFPSQPHTLVTEVVDDAGHASADFARCSRCRHTINACTCGNPEGWPPGWR